MELVVGPGPQVPATLPWPFQHEPRLFTVRGGPAQTLHKSETTQVTEAFSFLAQSMVSTCEEQRVTILLGAFFQWKF